MELDEQTRKPEWWKVERGIARVRYISAIEDLRKIEIDINTIGNKSIYLKFTSMGKGSEAK